MEEPEYAEEYEQPRSAYGFPLPRKAEESDRHNRWKIDPDDVIKEAIHQLRGDQWDEYDCKWIEDKNSRLVNELGLKVISAKLRAVLNKNIILSNFEREMINRIAMQSAINMAKLIYMQYDKFEIERENFDTVFEIVDNNIYAALLRGKDGFFVNHLSTTQRYIEQSNITMQSRGDKRKSFVPSIFGNWGNKDE